MRKTVIALTIACMFVLAGCMTAGRFVASTSSTVEKALQSWAVLKVDGKTTPAQDNAVREAQRRYYAAEDVAIASLSTTNWASAKAFLVEQQSALLALVEQFKRKETR